MALTPSVNPDVFTSEERWRRWEQRGLDNDARFMRRARGVFWAALVVMAGMMMVSVLY